MSLILGLQFSADILSELRLHRHRAQSKWNSRIENIPVGDSCEDARNTLFGIRLVEVEVLGSAVDGFEAIRFNRTTRLGGHLAVRGKEIADDRTSIVGFPLEKMEERACDMDVQGNFILVRAVQLRDVVLTHVLAQSDGSEDLEVIRMRLLELLLERLIVGFGIIRISLLNKVEIRIYKCRPEELAQFQLQSVRLSRCVEDNGSRIPCRYQDSSRSSLLKA